jgi:hypothetical protein
VTRAHLRGLILQTFEQFVEGSVPTFECLCKIPTGRLGCGIGKRDGGVVGSTERSYKSSDERPKEFDEYGLECTQEFVDVCELEDALVCDLNLQNMSLICAEKQEGSARQR